MQFLRRKRKNGRFYSDIGVFFSQFFSAARLRIAAKAREYFLSRNSCGELESLKNSLCGPQAALSGLSNIPRRFQWGLSLFRMDKHGGGSGIGETAGSAETAEGVARAGTVETAARAAEKHCRAVAMGKSRVRHGETGRLLRGSRAIAAEKSEGCRGEAFCARN